MSNTNNLSLYNRIKENLQSDGTLPEGFLLRGKPAEVQGKQFADGAIDGTIRYFMGPVANADISGLTVVLATASEGRFQDAINALLTHFLQGGTMLPVMDALQNWIYSNPQKLDPNKLGRFCRIILKESSDVESVKFAMSVLELLEQEDDELREIMLTLAKSEELTLFALFQIAQWEDGTEQIYKLAKSLKGWGRIHAVSLLRPENEEMERWMMTEGWHNSLMDEYSAMTVIKRCKLTDKLEVAEIDTDMFTIATDLIRAGLEDGPLGSIKDYKRGKELLDGYLRHAQKHSDAVDCSDVVAKAEEMLKNL